MAEFRKELHKTTLFPKKDYMTECGELKFLLRNSSVHPFFQGRSDGRVYYSFSVLVYQPVLDVPGYPCGFEAEACFCGLGIVAVLNRRGVGDISSIRDALPMI